MRNLRTLTIVPGVRWSTVAFAAKLFLFLFLVGCGTSGRSSQQDVQILDEINQSESQQQRADTYNTEEIRMRCQRCGKVVWRLRKDRQKAEDLLVDCLTGEVSVGGIPRPHIFAPD